MNRENLANAELAAAINDSQTSITLKTGQGGNFTQFPLVCTMTPPGQLSTKDNSEVVLLTDVTSDTATITRAQYGFSAKSFPTGSIIANGIYKEDFDAIQDAIDLKYDASNPDGFVDATGAASASPVQSVAGKTGAVTLGKADVGLSNVDNLAPADMPVSTATQTALDGKAKKKPALVDSIKWEGGLTIAHRNGALVYPEESLEGLQACYEDGIVIEVDVRALADGTLVCTHDETVDRTMTNIPTGTVSSKTVAEWKAAKVKQYHNADSIFGTPAFFDEVLDKYGGKVLIVPELKESGAVVAFIDAIVSRGLERDVIAQSFDYSVCQQIAAAGIEVLYLNDNVTQTPSQLIADGIKFVGGWWSATGWSTERLQLYKDGGLRTIGYTVTTREDSDAAFLRGWEGIFSNNPWLTARQEFSVRKRYSNSNLPYSKADLVQSVHNGDSASQYGQVVSVTNKQSGNASSYSQYVRHNVIGGGAANDYLYRGEFMDNGALKGSVFKSRNRNTGEVYLGQRADDAISRYEIISAGDSPNEAQLDLVSGSKSTRHFYRESDGAYGFYHEGSTKIRIDRQRITLGSSAVPTRINNVDYLSGTGFPEGIITALVGSIYIDKAITNGASSWIKKSGTGNTGWQVLEGDTGWRDITSALENGYTASQILIRRANNTVSLIVKDVIGSGSSTARMMAVPVGFKHGTTNSGAGVPDFTVASISSLAAPVVRAFVIGADSNMYNYYNGAGATSPLRVSFSYLSREGYPTTLPGTAL